MQCRMYCVTLSLSYMRPHIREQETTFHSNGQWEIVYCWHLNTIFQFHQLYRDSMKPTLFAACKCRVSCKNVLKILGGTQMKKKKKKNHSKAIYEHRLNVLAQNLLNFLRTVSIYCRMSYGTLCGTAAHSPFHIINTFPMLNVFISILPLFFCLIEPTLFLIHMNRAGKVDFNSRTATHFFISSLSESLGENKTSSHIEIDIINVHLNRVIWLFEAPFP